MALALDSDAARAYAVLAPAYGLLTAEYAYGPWLAVLERLALRHGLAGRRLLAAVGQRPGAVLDDELDERVHRKAVFVTRRDGSSR
jgi:hypothetical protein